MKSSKLLLSFVVASAALAALPAFAQQAPDNTQTMERMDRIERDVMLLQRQVARGEGGSTNPGGDANVPAGGSAQLEVRLSAIEDQLRDLRGKIEENENHVRKLTESMDKLQHDTDFRLNELSHAQPPAAMAAPPQQQQMAGTQMQTSSSMDIKQAGDNSTVKPLLDKQAPASGGNELTAIGPNNEAVSEPKQDAKNDGKPDLSKPAEKAPTSFASPREHYNYAFKLLNQTQYEEAAASFESFTKKYPKDPLVGNAFYWEGETYYIRRDYVNAADFFRQGFEAMPDGPKAADNLLKLSMSLDALNRDKEACLVLQQITNKYKKTAENIVDKADAEIKRIGCRATASNGH